MKKISSKREGLEVSSKICKVKKPNEFLFWSGSNGQIQKEIHTQNFSFYEGLKILI